MKIGIMQPYFFPYIGYFSLIKNTDRFILFDTVQFIKHGWIERNRILNQREGWQYVTVPLVKYNRETKINEIQINDTQKWREKIIAQLVHYKRKAKFYNKTIDIVERALDIETDSIVKLNENIMKVVCEYLEIDLKIDIFSEMDLIIDKVTAPDEWALNICKALGNIDEYWNPYGGIDFFNRDKYEKEDIGLKFLKMNTTEYVQRRDVFEPALSIIDVIMFNTPKQINDMLDRFDIL